MILYDVPGNSNSRKIRAVALDLNAVFETIPVDMMNGEHKSPAFLARNPNGKVPVLVDQDFALWESNAIMTYIAQKFGPTKLLPTSLKERAQVDQWLYWQTAHMSPAFGKIAFERIYKERMNLGAPDQNAINAGIEEVKRFCTVLDTTLQKTNFVAGPELTVADYAIASTLSMREMLFIDLAPYKAVGAWLQRVESRPSWVNAK